MLDSTAELSDAEAKRGAHSRLGQRDEELAALFRQHYAALYRLAYLLLRDTGLAEEVVMDSFVKTFSGWGRLRDTERAPVYLRRTVINTARSKIRRQIIERRATNRFKQMNPPPAAEPQLNLEQSRIWELVRALPVRQRACVVLRYFEDLSEAQIAEILECSVGTVKSQLSRARARLQKSFDSSVEEEKL
jgi:RNA polymerase sigma-70 factor (sigma-E family)